MCFGEKENKDMEKINISKLSSKYGVRKLTEADIELIYNLCLKNQQYYEYCEKQLSVEQIQQDLKITPPNKSLSDKYYVGFFDEEKLVAVLSYQNSVSEFNKKSYTLIVLHFSANNKLQYTCNH